MSSQPASISLSSALFLILRARFAYYNEDRHDSFSLALSSKSSCDGVTPTLSVLSVSLKLYSTGLIQAIIRVCAFPPLREKKRKENSVSSNHLHTLFENLGLLRNEHSPPRKVTKTHKESCNNLVSLESL